MACQHLQCRLKGVEIFAVVGKNDRIDQLWSADLNLGCMKRLGPRLVKWVSRLCCKWRIRVILQLTSVDGPSGLLGDVEERHPKTNGEGKHLGMDKHNIDHKEDL